MLTQLIEITRAGGDLAFEMKRQPQHIKSKDGSSWNYTTQVDPMIEELIIDRLNKEFPGIPIVAEEQAEHFIPSGTFFTVDPIDGTIGYSNGFSNWGTMIGYIEDGQPHRGVIVMPEWDIVISAEKGEGCYLNNERVQLDYARPLAETVVETEIGPWIPSDRWPVFSSLRTKCRWLGGSGMAAASTADLLLGKAGAYPNFNCKIWDLSAGALAIQEAGGVACRPNGEPLTWDQINMQALFAANAQLAAEILAIIQEG